MDENYLKFLETATNEEIENLIKKLEMEEDRDLEEEILFLSSFLV